MNKNLKPFHYLTLVMVVLFVIMGLGCFFSSTIERDYLHSPRNYVMGTVFILYAAMRFYRVRADIKKHNAQ